MKKPIFKIVLRAEPHPAGDVNSRLKLLLKLALRSFGFRCLGVESIVQCGHRGNRVHPLRSKFLDCLKGNRDIVAMELRLAALFKPDHVSIEIGTRFECAYRSHITNCVVLINVDLSEDCVFPARNRQLHNGGARNDRARFLEGCQHIACQITAFRGTRFFAERAIKPDCRDFGKPEGDLTAFRSRECAGHRNLIITSPFYNYLKGHRGIIGTLERLLDWAGVKPDHVCVDDITRLERAGLHRSSPPVSSVRRKSPILFAVEHAGIIRRNLWSRHGSESSDEVVVEERSG